LLICHPLLENNDIRIKSANQKIVKAICMKLNLHDSDSLKSHPTLLSSPLTSSNLDFAPTASHYISNYRSYQMSHSVDGPSHDTKILALVNCMRLPRFSNPTKYNHTSNSIIVALNTLIFPKEKSWFPDTPSEGYAAPQKERPGRTSARGEADRPARAKVQLRAF
jgi:hypothetical protein